MPRFDLLANLEREDGQTLAALSRRMLVTAGNLTGLVDRAERDGSSKRRADPRDRRLSRVFLTARGRAPHHRSSSRSTPTTSASSSPASTPANGASSAVCSASSATRSTRTACRRNARRGPPQKRPS